MKKVIFTFAILVFVGAGIQPAIAEQRSEKNEGHVLVLSYANDKHFLTVEPTRDARCAISIDLNSLNDVSWIDCLFCPENGETVGGEVVVGGYTLKAALTSGSPTIASAEITPEYDSCSFKVNTNAALEDSEAPDLSYAYIEGRVLVRKCDGAIIAGEADVFRLTKNERAAFDIVGNKPEPLSKIKWARVN